MITFSGWEDVSQDAIRLESFLEEAKFSSLKDAAAAGCDIIQSRTILEHKDKYGDEFAPYSESPTAFEEGDKYYEYAQRAGGTPYTSGGRGRIYFDSYRQFKSGLGDESPNLYVSGELMGMEGHERPWDIGPAKPDEFSIDIVFTGKADVEEVAQEHIDGSGKPQRDFWGIADNDKEIEDLSNIIAEKMDKSIDEFFGEVGWH